MSKTKGRVLLAVIAALLVSNWFYARKAKASGSSQISYGQPACRSYVPISWGEYMGAAKDYGVVFRDNSGTLRFINSVPCEAIPPVSLEIRRGNPPN
jgi:hypothetical protein